MYAFILFFYQGRCEPSLLASRPYALAYTVVHLWRLTTHVSVKPRGQQTAGVQNNAALKTNKQNVTYVKRYDVASLTYLQVSYVYASRCIGTLAATKEELAKNACQLLMQACLPTSSSTQGTAQAWRPAMSRWRSSPFETCRWTPLLEQPGEQASCGERSQCHARPSTRDAPWGMALRYTSTNTP